MRRLRAFFGFCAAAFALVAIAPAAADGRTEIVKLRSPPFHAAGFQVKFPKVDVATPRRSGYITRMQTWLIEGNQPAGSIDAKQSLWRMPLSGRIVAAGGHLHGSSYGLTVSQPRCGERTLIDQRPLFGLSTDLVYRARPMLHEPGPAPPACSCPRPASRSARARCSG